MDKKTKIFVIMPFEDEFFEVYEMLKIKFENDYEFSNASVEGNQDNIINDIIKPIYDSDIVLADLTGLNPNVMYELGIAHSMNKKTIIITKDELSELPFDLKSYRAKDYTTHFKKFDELVRYLEKNMKGAINGNVSFSNPVRDAIRLKDLETKDWFEEKELIELKDDTDNGFLDFMAGIEENALKLTANIDSMSSEIDEMSNGISKSGMEINRVNASGGSGTVSFVRKEAKKAAKFVDVFGKQLREHNNTIPQLWDGIENNTLGLLENRFALNEENRNSLVEYLKSLLTIKKSAKTNKEAITELIDSMKTVNGIERSMNQAIRFVEQDLKTYVEILDGMSDSIERIIEKSKYVVGEIELEDEANVEKIEHKVEIEH